MDENRTYSISLRLRRTITEEAFVQVPVNEDIMQAGVDDQGYHHIDPQKLMQAAVRLGNDAATTWRVESPPVIEPHPIQAPPPGL